MIFQIVVDTIKKFSSNAPFNGCHVCAAAINVHQHESLDCLEESIPHAYELFEKNGNRAIVIKELASVS